MEWVGQIFRDAHSSNHSKGLGVLIKPNSPIHAETKELDANGRFMLNTTSPGVKTPSETSFRESSFNMTREGGG